jgi:hypothetical protein
VNRATAEQFVNQLDATFKSVGADTYDSGMDLACTLFERLLAVMKMLRTRQAAIDVLQEMTGSAEEQQFLISATQMLPRLVSALVQEVAEEAKATLPPPRVGRPRALSEEQRTQMIALILSLIGTGAGTSEAKKRAARTFGVSKRTTDAVWKTRGTITPPDFDSVLRWLRE